jgi:hypothetical protein
MRLLANSIGSCANIFCGPWQPRMGATKIGRPRGKPEYSAIGDHRITSTTPGPRHATAKDQLRTGVFEIRSVTSQHEGEDASSS